MHVDRIFTFGCSFTNFIWPTWANIIAYDLDLPTQNWGVAGMGNEGIFCRMLECDLRNKFTERDLILVLWSSWTREDRFIDRCWKSYGDVYNYGFFDKNFIKKYWSMSNDIIKNSTYILSANKMYDIKFQGHISPLSYKNMDLDPIEKTMINLYDQHLPQENIFEYKNDPDFLLIIEDPHPSIMSHLLYVKNVVYKNLGLTLKPTTEFIVDKIQKEIIQLKRTAPGVTIFELRSKILGIIGKFNFHKNMMPYNTFV
jgi:hypothetical protein